MSDNDEAIVMALRDDVSANLSNTSSNASVLPGIPLCFGNQTHTNDNDPISDLYPAIVECFSIIFLGYIAGRLHIITHLQSQGLGSYLTKFALPALLFKSMAEMKFGVVNWMFLASILVIKCAVYFLVMFFTVVLTRSTNFGKIGIYSIFVTQSNDIALGLPIINALYEGYNTEFQNYLYLIQPINMILLNPLGFVFLEIYRWKHLPLHERSSKLKAVFTVIKGIVLNPIISMTALGVVGNFVFKQNIPRPISDFLTTLANSFSALALFYLGYSMHGKIGNQNKKSLITAILLLCAKMLLMPFLAHEITVWMLSPSTSPKLTNDLASFAFLYGTLPTAPAVFLFANHYAVAQNVIATGVVVGTFMCAPVMFISAKVVLIHAQNWDSGSLLKLVTHTASDISILNIVCTVWVLVVLVLGRRIRSIPHQLTACLTVSQLLTAVWMLLYLNLRDQSAVKAYTFYTLYLTSVYTSYACMAAIAVATSSLGVKSLCYVLRKRFMLFIYIFCVPATFVALLWGFSRLGHTPESITTAFIFFPFGQAQLIISTVYITLNVVLSLTALIFHHRRSRDHVWGASSRLPSMADPGGSQEGPSMAGSDRREDPLNNNSIPDPTAVPVVTVTEDQQTATEDPESALQSLDVQGPLTTSSQSSQPSGILHSSTSRPGTRRRKRVSLKRSSGLALKKTCSQCQAGQICRNACDDIEDILANCSIGSAVSHDFHTVSNPPSLRPHPEESTDDNTPLISSNNDLQSFANSLPNTNRTYCTLAAAQQQLSTHIQPDIDSALTNQTEEYMCPEDSANLSFCDRSENGKCHLRLVDYLEGRFYLMNEEEKAVASARDEHQVVRHIVLVIMLLMASISELMLSVWRLFSQAQNGLYVELEFLNMAIVAGQGVFTFAVFGFDTEMVLNPIFRKIRKLVKGNAEISLPYYCDLDDETKRAVETFTDYYLDSCRQDVARCHWYKLRRYQFTFLGHELVDWIIDRGLASERSEAIIMGSRLLKGQVIEHVHKEQFFQDVPYLYRFIIDQGNK